MIIWNVGVYYAAPSICHQIYFSLEMNEKFQFSVKYIKLNIEKILI